MNKRLVIFGVGALIIGLVYLNNRTVPDRNVFAGTNSSQTSASTGSVDASQTVATPSPSPVASPNSDVSPQPKHHDSDKDKDSAESARKDGDDHRGPLVTPSPEPTIAPQPTVMVSPQPSPIGCRPCPPWNGPGPRPMIMCPMACLDRAQ